MSENCTNGDICKRQAVNGDKNEQQGETRLKCNKCFKCFKKKKDLERHERTHTGQKPFECNQCGKNFNRKGNLNQHKRTHTGEKGFKCNYCYKCFGHKGHLNEHKRIHTGEKPFKCNQCDKRFSRKGLLKQHRETYHLLSYLGNMETLTSFHTSEETHSVSANQCDTYFDQTRHLQLYKTTHEQDKTLNCDDNDESRTHGVILEKETQATNLTRQSWRESVHMAPDTVQALTMSANSVNSDMCEHQTGNVDEHERQGEQPLEGNQYDKCFVSKGDLEQRKMTRTARENVFQCNHCSKRFRTKWRLVGHERTHTGEKPYECNQCSKRFANKGNLNQHKKTHTGEKPFKCNYCNKCFSHKGHLNEHKRIHTGEKPFKCNQCNRCFARAGILRQHKRTHTGELPFKCGQCEKRFNQKGLLSHHLKKHAGENRSKCDKCEQLLSDQSKVQILTVINTGENLLKGNFCDNCFHENINLQQHKTTDDGNTPSNCDQGEMFETGGEGPEIKIERTNPTNQSFEGGVRDNYFSISELVTNIKREEIRLICN